MKWFILFCDKVIVLFVRKELKDRLGAERFALFIQEEKKSKERIYPLLSWIGKSIFASSYYIGNCYFFWMEALRAIGMSDDEAVSCIIFINEIYMKKIPPCIRNMIGASYLRQHRKRAPEAAARSAAGKTHAYDWTIRYRKNDASSWEIDITSCYIDRMARILGMRSMLPGICRMDHMMSHYFNQEFRRTQTIGDGDSHCNCFWRIPGNTDWPITDPQQK